MPFDLRPVVVLFALFGCMKKASWGLMMKMQNTSRAEEARLSSSSHLEKTYKNHEIAQQSIAHWKNCRVCYSDFNNEILVSTGLRTGLLPVERGEEALVHLTAAVHAALPEGECLRRLGTDVPGEGRRDAVS